MAQQALPTPDLQTYSDDAIWAQVQAVASKIGSGVARRMIADSAVSIKVGR